MFRRILVPIDGSATAERGLQEAIGLAAEQKAALVLLHVIDAFPSMVEMSSTTSFEQMRSNLVRYGEELLAAASKTAADAGVASERLLREVMRSRVADVIVEEAAKAGCDLIVMGTHGRRGFSRLALGSDAERVLRQSPVPVLVLRHESSKG